MAAVKWTTIWPVKTGMYWFYGWMQENQKGPPEMTLAGVYTDSTGYSTYIANGRFINRADGAWGVWKEALLPNIPNLREYGMEDF